VSLLDDDDVYFVTNDKAFFKNRKYTDGLASNLLDDLVNKEHELRIFSSVSELINDIATPVELDLTKLEDCFYAKYKKSINGILDRNGMKLASDHSTNVTSYITENPNKLYIEFEIEYSCEDAHDGDKIDGRLLLKGDGFANTQEETYSDLRNFGEKLTFKSKGEELTQQNHVIHAGGMVIGHKEVSHSVRYELD